MPGPEDTTVIRIATWGPDGPDSTALVLEWGGKLTKEGEQVMAMVRRHLEPAPPTPVQTLQDETERLGVPLPTRANPG